jgi:hypothetical protein
MYEFENVPSKHAERTLKELMRALSSEHMRQELMHVPRKASWGKSHENPSNRKLAHFAP